MKSQQLQLLVYGDDLQALHPSIEYAAVSIERVIRVENPNYLFLDLRLGPTTKAGSFSIDFKAEDKIVESHRYELKEREATSAEREGFQPSDVMYLITPDRFVNGDPTNDEVAGMKEKHNRRLKGGRHGGDIEGIRQRLDYLSEMGFTAIWLNSVLENDMYEYSYHGYSTTDYYKVDPRLGSNESYQQMSKEARQKGIKLIMDMIVNHCGSEHWWMNDLPSSDWLNSWEGYVGTNHTKTLLQDPYASALDKKVFTDGWFVPSMPDLNQRNALMATYLTQNSIWWIEYAGLAGIRMDTYSYPDMDYMAKWTQAIMAEYPYFTIVGEEWHEQPAIVAYWQQGKKNPNGYTSSLSHLMDFPLQINLTKSLLTKEKRDTGWMHLYSTLALDFLYADPHKLVVFPDNHDMSRIFTQLNEDFGLYKIALTFFLTTRGTPQLYYGTEILMSNPGTTDHGIIRTDFPGGWAGDPVNGFTNKGLTKQQIAAKNFVKKLLHWRKTAEVIHNGKLMHFVPENGVYVYFRYNDKRKVMVILNKNKGKHLLNPRRFEEMLKGTTSGTDVLSGKQFQLGEMIDLPAKAPLLLELE